jgi:hypothetical protein
MSNSVVLHWNTSDSRVLQPTTVSRWREVSRGLQLSGLGYAILLIVVLPALVLIWVSSHGYRYFPVPASLRQNEDWEFLGWFLAAVAGPLGYLVTLLGQWRCLKLAPQGHGAKELLFTCILCLLVAPLLLGIAHFTGGARNYALYLEGLEGLHNLNWLLGGVLLQLAGMGLLLLNFLLFAQFLRAIGECLGRSAVARLVEFYSFFVCLLLGSSVGTVLCGHSFAFGRTAIPVLLAGWLGYFLWHLVLTFVVRRQVDLGLLGVSGAAQPGIRSDAKDSSKRYSGVHRLFHPPVS